MRVDPSRQCERITGNRPPLPTRYRMLHARRVVDGRPVPLVGSVPKGRQRWPCSSSSSPSAAQNTSASVAGERLRKVTSTLRSTADASVARGSRCGEWQPQCCAAVPSSVCHGTSALNHPRVPGAGEPSSIPGPDDGQRIDGGRCLTHPRRSGEPEVQPPTAATHGLGCPLSHALSTVRRCRDQVLVCLAGHPSQQRRALFGGLPNVA